MRRIIGHSLLLLLLGGCSRATAPDDGSGTPAVVQSIAQLKASCGSTGTVIRQEIAVQGVVTGNDRYGEFVRQLVIEDATGGLLIDIEATELHQRYPVGMRLTLHCNGLTLMNYGGRIELMADPSDPYGRNGIAAGDLARFLYPAAGSGEAPRPALRQLGELGADQLDTFVRVEGVRFAATAASEGLEAAWCRRDPQSGETLTTEHTLIDRAGSTFIVRVPATADYARDALPTGEGALCGIVGRFDGHYVLRVADHGIYFDE